MFYNEQSGADSDLWKTPSKKLSAALTDNEILSI